MRNDDEIPDGEAPDGSAPEESREPDAGAVPGGRTGSSVRTTMVLGLAVVVSFVVGAVGVSLLGSDPAPAPEGLGGAPPIALEDRVSPTQSAPLPDVTLEGFEASDGKREDIRLADYRGGPTIVNFWASWCAPCVAEMPDFQTFFEDHGDEVALLGVNVQDAPANARAFVEQLDITYDLAVDRQGDLFAQVQGFAMPTTLFVDADGTIVYRHSGPLDLEQLRERVDTHLGVSL